MPAPFSLEKSLCVPLRLCARSEGPEAHAARGRDGRQEGRECGYYHLHRQEDLRYSYNQLYGEEVKGNGREVKEELKGQYKIPIIISSGYRSEEVNMKCGGAKNSNHLTGCAVDIHCYGPEQMIRMAGILLDIADGTKREFDELILEKRGSTYWVHFAVRPRDNRRKILFDCR